jgi:hypothetical protein
MPVPYYDCADNRLLDMLTSVKAERYLVEGIAHAMRSKKGRLLRLYSVTREHVYGSGAEAVRAMNGAASQTTQRIRNEQGVLIAPPTHREHKIPCSDVRC